MTQMHVSLFQSNKALAKPGMQDKTEAQELSSGNELKVNCFNHTAMQRKI